MKKGIVVILLFLAATQAISQVVFQDLSNLKIYSFVDELADLKIIDVNSAIKPYSREFIASALETASQSREKLNKRQNRELDFYLREYNLELKPDLSWYKKGKGLFKNSAHTGIPLNPLALQYKDSLFTFSLKPIWGYTYYYRPANDGTGSMYHQWGGAEVFGYIGKHLGFWSSLRDNHEDRIRVFPVSYSREEGAAWKINETGGGDYSEMRGGISYEWKWGNVALTKDHFQWGDNYSGSNILSGHPPSFPYLQLRMTPVKWLDYSFITGWLVSQVIDSSESYNVAVGRRNAWFNKFLSCAMLTVTPVKGLKISAGGSVISASEYYNPALLSPFLFYFDYNYKGDSFQKKYYGTNTAFFINISSRQIRHLHLYASLFADDIKSSWISYKAGIHGSFGNLIGTVEYTRSNSDVFTSEVSTLTYASNRYNLGYFLRNDIRDVFLSLEYKILRGLHAMVSYENRAFYMAFPQIVPEPAKNIYTIAVEYEFISNATLRTSFQQDENVTEFGFGFNIGF